MSEIKARRLSDIINDRHDKEKILVAEFAARVANAIETLREHEDVTLSELAHRVGSSTSQMSRVLSGEYTGMTLTTLVRISAGLGYRPNLSFQRAPATRSLLPAGRAATHAAPAMARMSAGSAHLTRGGRQADR